MFRGLSRSSRRQAFPHMNAGLSLPRAGLLFDIPNRYPFADRVGRHDGPSQLRQFAEVTSGTVTLYHPAITGSETIASSEGDASVSVIVGGIVIGVGKKWSIKDSAGHHWSHCSALSQTSVVMWDVSGLGDHLVATGLAEAVVAALCSSGRDLTVGTDWLDHGFTVAGELYQVARKANGSRLLPDNLIVPALEDGSACAGYIFTGEVAPLGAILHYDAEVEPLSELVGGVHTLNHAVLGPQYQRLADGSYINVGNQPAVDVLAGGFKGLRGCGAITNLLPTGSNNLDSSHWSYSGGATCNPANVSGPSGVADAYEILAPVNSYVNKAATPAYGSAFSFSVWIKGETGKTVQLKSNLNALSTWASVPVGWGGIGTSTASRNITLTGEWQEVVFSGTTAAAISSGSWYPLYLIDRRNGTTAEWLHVWGPMLTATAYPVPYIPPGVTQPASNATTTNGAWFANPDGSPLWQALTGSPFTLATRVKMGVGSADLPNNVVANILYTGSKDVIRYSKSTDGTSRIVASDDGASIIVVNGVFVRNAVIRRFSQVNDAGNRFRVGYMIEGTHTTIQWSSPSDDSTTWAVFDGSFNPSTLYRFMLGYSNPYPMWFNKITAWKRQVPTTELVEAWA